MVVHSVRDVNVVAKTLQTQAPRTTLSRKTLIPLKGAESFSALMRARPLVVWGQCMVHAHIKPVNLAHPISELDQIADHRIELGLIVPKKAFVLAVDRNRIRRVLRAQCFVLAKELPCSIQLLFRIKPLTKKSAKPKGHALASTPPTKVLCNPHSEEFTVALKQGLSQALAIVTAASQRKPA